MSSPPLLKYYEPNKPLVLQCDGSEKGLDASLLQEGKPVSYARRALTTTEMLAQVEKELLAIVFGVERFRQYTYGRRFLVDSDHKPLTRHSENHSPQSPEGSEDVYAFTAI